MKERIFIISPLPEDEEEEKLPYDERGNTTAMAYYNEQGNTIETDYEEQPEENNAIEKHITIIYEASKPKVITEENPAPEAIPIFPKPEEMPAYSQPEARYDKFLNYSKEKRAEARNTILTYVYGENASEAKYDKFLSYSYGNQPIEQGSYEASQIVSIRSELAQLTPETGAPASQAGEIQAAA